MSIISTFILASLCLVYVSAMAITPKNAPSIPIWDVERATSFNALLAASLKSTRQTHGTNSILYATKSASSSSANITKAKTVPRKANQPPSLTNVPMGGMQCAVM